MKLGNLFTSIKTETKPQTPVKKAENQTAPNTMAAQAAATDRVELSSNSMDVQKMQGILRQIPDVRLAKVQDLKEQINNGAYQVDPYRVADKMLTDLLSEQVSVI
ncbi:MAG: flagellar biosynthesis anti-sigma factor FlgM [Deltaproteobacteria bacterium CG_4_10_14_3_um_filter_60_8]|nr:MAG: flagellar biosynthesis anti-sigma factor FlgM [Desulfobacterales bacterium CG2_30_60_27]PIP44104.1 MAG: flagellar biosynthesis anti-sigma factor FlgM [Deltaproteobacteria bacterium CG23_combo_of_CG06-09_8_20_14_all_60_8]PIY24813.1 MAG: flagellar biosynthesis anti-sigma factor FlgM [Deltaproteobacteria bacterium CG_4_10_14_3_um_filter_60_8]